MSEILSVSDQELIEKFVKRLEEGDLYFNSKFKNVHALYGQTKVGKTSSSHLLAGCVLAGRKEDGIASVEVVSNKYKLAKIGNKIESQTDIPNIFELGGQKFIIDTPGYADSQGVLKILSNTYHHYRVYSQSENMKFILTFDNAHLDNIADKFTSTIIEFTSFFKDYHLHSKTIWQSCCFLFTKCNNNQSQTVKIQNLKSRLLTIANKMKTQQQKLIEQLLKDFIRFIVNEDRIFVIPSAQNHKILECKGLLDRIDQKISKWWHREIKQGVVDMSLIQFPAAKQINISITAHKKNKEQFKKLILYYNQKIKQILKLSSKQYNVQYNNDGKKLNPLQKIINTLVTDAMGLPSQHSFLKTMHHNVRQNYDKFDSSCNDLRLNKEKQLFSLDTASMNNQTSSKKNLKDSNYVVKKFKALEQIQKYKKNASQIYTNKRGLGVIEKFQQNLYKIIKQLNLVCYNRTNSAKIIYKYGYLIYRVLQQSKIFCLLLQIQPEQELKKSLLELTDSKGFDIERQFKDYMAVDFIYRDDQNFNYKLLHKKYVDNFDPHHQNMKKINIDLNFLKFFTNGIQINKDITKKVNKLILEYSDRILSDIEQKIQTSLQDRKILIQKLTSSRVNSQILIDSISDSNQIQEQVIFLRRITQNLAKLLQFNLQYDLAKQVYNSIKFVVSVCSIYQKQMIEKPNDIMIRIKYSKYLSDHLRHSDAVKVLQQSFQIVRDRQCLEKVKEEFIELIMKIKKQDNSLYENQLYQSNYFSHFKDLQGRIKQYSAN